MVGMFARDFQRFLIASFFKRREVRMPIEIEVGVMNLDRVLTNEIEMMSTALLEQ